MIVLDHENHDKMAKCYTSSTFTSDFDHANLVILFPWFQIHTKKFDKIRLSNVYFFECEHLKHSV